MQSIRGMGYSPQKLRVRFNHVLIVCLKVDFGLYKGVSVHTHTHTHTHTHKHTSFAYHEL